MILSSQPLVLVWRTIYCLSQIHYLISREYAILLFHSPTKLICECLCGMLIHFHGPDQISCSLICLPAPRIYLLLLPVCPPLRRCMLSIKKLNQCGIVPDIQFLSDHYDSGNGLCGLPHAWVSGDRTGNVRSGKNFILSLFRRWRKKTARIRSIMTWTTWVRVPSLIGS